MDDAWKKIRRLARRKGISAKKAERRLKRQGKI